jgi:F-type H+-transporting ATPase subunit b
MNPRDWIFIAEAWAAGGAEHHPPEIAGIIFPLLNFLIYAGIIYYFAVPLIRSFLKSRHDEVLATVTEAAARKRNAEALVADYESRLAKVDQEIDSIQASLKAEGERDKARLLREAEGLATKIKSDAQLLADQEVKAAKYQVLLELAERAKVSASDLIRRHLSQADQGRLVEEFIDDLGQIR